MNDVFRVTQAEYHQWLDRIYELLDFGEEYRNKCRKDLRLSKRAADDLDLDWASVMAAAEQNGHACCDCELLFNCDDRPAEY